MLSKKIKLSLNYKQELILNTLSNEHRVLYNFLLEKVKEKTNLRKDLEDLIRLILN